MKHIKYLKGLNACSEAIAFAKKNNTLQAAWDACEKGSWMLWLLSKQAGPPESESRRRLVFIAAQCAREALSFTTDARVLKCIEACEAYSRREINMVALRGARTAAAAAYAGYATSAAAAAAAYAAYAAAAYASAAANLQKMQKTCADIVRKHHPVIKLETWKEPK